MKNQIHHKARSGDLGNGIVILQIGANRADDDLTQIVKIIGSDHIKSLVLVEPLPVHTPAIARCYSDIECKIVINAAIVPDANMAKAKQIIDFWYHKSDGPFYELASTSKDHIQKHAGSRPALLDDSGYTICRTQCIDVNSLLQAIGHESIDILFIDAEGLDSELVLAIDLKIVNIGHIFFENLHLPEGRAAENSSVYRHLEASGMSIRRKCLSNGWSSHAFTPNWNSSLTFLESYK